MNVDKLVVKKADGKTDQLEETSALTLAQWLPKPATSWMPQVGRPLRGTWSPRRGENKLPLLLALTFITVMPVLAVPPPSGVAPLLVPNGGFVIDWAGGNPVNVRTIQLVE